MRISDWSSDVCSSDLAAVGAGGDQVVVGVAEGPGRAAVDDARGRGQRDRAGAGVGQRRMRHRSARDAAQGSHGRLDLRVGDGAAGAVAQRAERGRGQGDVAARSEENTSELQSLMRISYAVVCLTKKKKRR